MKAFTVEWVFVHDVFQQNPCIDRECDPRITVPVVRLAQVDELLKEAVWAMKFLRQQQAQWDGYVPPGHLQRAEAFLASSDVAAWRERDT